MKILEGHSGGMAIFDKPQSAATRKSNSSFQTTLHIRVILFSPIDFKIGDMFVRKSTY